MKVKQIHAAALTAAMLSGCGAPAPATEPAPVQTTVPKTTVETTLPTQTIPVETAPQMVDDLIRLREDLKPPVAASGYFGYWSTDISAEPGAFVREEFPNYWASNAYLSEINHVYGEYGTLYCVVPRLPDTEVTVNLVRYGDYPYELLTSLSRPVG